MIFAEEVHMLDGRKIILRSARTDESQMLIDYLKLLQEKQGFNV